MFIIKSELKGIYPAALALIIYFCAAALAPGSARAAGEISFPLGVNDSVSATFCEYRAGHLHAGVDLRTKRRTGIPVLAPSDGKVIRLYGDENGYGLMLELAAANGFKYKFAHLASFENETLGLMDAVRAARAESGRRFNFDIDLSGRNVAVKAGQVVAFSGDTGAGPPHLHFEVSDLAGNMVNPFKYMPLDSVADATPVRIVSALFIPQDEDSLVEGAPLSRTFHFGGASAAKGSGSPDLSVRAVGRLKIAVRAFDENKFFADNESRTGIYKIQIKESGAAGGAGRVIYALGFDSAGADVSRAPETVYDMYYSSISAGNFYYRLFDAGAVEKTPSFVEAAGGGGVIEVKEGEIRYFEITASDYFNNSDAKIVKITGGASKSPENGAEGGHDAGGAVLAWSAGGPRNSSNKSASEVVSTRPGPAKGKKISAKAVRPGSSAKVKAPGKSNGKNIPTVEYSDNVIIFKISSAAAAAGSKITHAGKEMKKFDRDGYACYYIGYESFLAAPSICVEAPGGSLAADEAASSRTGAIARGQAEPGVSKKVEYGLKIYKLQADKPVPVSADGSFAASAESAAGRRRPVYAGESRLVEVSFLTAGQSSPEAPGSSMDKNSPPEGNASPEKFLDLSFSGPVRSAVLYCKVTAGTGGGREGLYDTLSKRPAFLGNGTARYGGETYLCANVKNVRRVRCALMRDEKPPQLKISKKSGARLVKPVRPAAKPESDLLSFFLSDAETGVSRSGIKYFIDGVESGNFEFFAGGLLNCYLYDLKTGAGLKPGEHAVKVEATDNSGNRAVYEKSFRVAGAAERIGTADKNEKKNRKARKKIDNK